MFLHGKVLTLLMSVMLWISTWKPDFLCARFAHWEQISHDLELFVGSQIHRDGKFFTSIVKQRQTDVSERFVLAHSFYSARSGLHPSISASESSPWCQAFPRMDRQTSRAATKPTIVNWFHLLCMQAQANGGSPISHACGDSATCLPEHVVIHGVCRPPGQTHREGKW